MEAKPAIAVFEKTVEHAPSLNRLSYMPQLDGLRAVAISLVLVGHFYSKASSIPIPLAWLGVQLFFVLSGFLITKIMLLQKNKIDTHILKKSDAIKTFYIRRVLRLFPLYYLVLALALLFDFEKVREIWVYLALYLTNVKMAINAGWIGDYSHLWSLAAEEQFYLLWPWLIIFFRPKYLPWILTLVMLSGLIFRAVMVFTGQSIFTNMLLFGVTDALGGGALLAVVSNLSASNQFYVRIKAIYFRMLPIAGITGLIGAMVLFTSVEWSSPTFSIWATLLTSFPFAWIVWRSSSGFGGILGGFLSSRPVIYLGKISYGVYIIHAFVPSILMKMNVNPGILPKGVEAWFLVITTTTIILASASWFVLERPANRLKSYYKY